MGPPPPVPAVAQCRLLEDEAVPLEVPEVVGGGPGVQPEPLGKPARGRRTVEAQQAEDAEPHRVRQGLEPARVGYDGAGRLSVHGAAS